MFPFNFNYWLDTLRAAEENLAAKEGCREIGLRHQIRAGCNLLNLFLLFELIMIAFGYVMKDSGCKFRGEIYSFLYFGIAFLIASALAFLLNKLCNLFWLSIFTLTFAALWGWRLYYCLTHYDGDLLNSDFIVF